MYTWIASLVDSGAVKLNVVSYTQPGRIPDRPFGFFGGSPEHRQLQWNAMQLFRAEEKEGAPIYGYGLADGATKVRLIECGVVPPIKLIRAWAVGFRVFTTMPFEPLVTATFTINCESLPSLRTKYKRRGLLPAAR